MAQSVGDLIVNLDVDNTRFTEQMERVIRHTGSFGKAANDASAQAQQMADRQASALKSLLNSIDPTTKAFSNLDDQYTALQQHLNAGRIDASQFEYYNHILDESLTKLVDVGDAQEKVAEQARRTAAAESAATKRFLEGIDPTLRAFNRLDESVAELHQRFESGFIPEAQFKSTLAMLEQQRAKLYEVGDAAELTESAMGGMPAALSRHELAAKRAGISVGQYTQALRFLPMQMTDVVTQLAGGQNPLLILIQQGGQVKDAFGGIRPAMVAMGDSLKGLIGVLNPVNLAIAVAVATLVAIPSSMAFASSSLGDIQKSLIMTGAAAFASAGDMANASERIGNATNTSFAATSSLMAELVQKGKYTGKQIEVITKATLDWGRATGGTKDKVEGFFSQIADDPVQSMKALNNQFDFLSKAQAEHIATLDKAGQHTQAVTELTNLLADTIDKRSQDIIDNMSPLEKAWEDVKKWASDTAIAVGIDFNAMASMVIDVVGALIDQIRGLLAHGDEIISNVTAGIAERAAKLPGLGSVFEPMAKSARESANEQRQIWTDAEKDNAERLKRLAAGMQGYRDTIWKGRQIAQGAGQKDAVADVVDNAKKPDKKPKAITESAGDRTLESFNEQNIALQSQLETLRKHRDINDTISQQRKDLWTIQAKFNVLEDAHNSRLLTAADKSMLAHEAEIKAMAEKNAIIGDEVVKQERLNRLHDDSVKYIEKAGAKQQAYLDSRGKSSREAQRIQEREDLKRQFKNASPDDRQAATDAQSQQFANEDKQRGDWESAAKTSWANYADAATDTYAQVQSVANATFDGLSQGLTDMLMTGKANFADFTKSILGMLAQILIKQSLVSGVSAVFGAEANANGGVYNSASLSAYSGSIVSRPTLFAFAKGAGVMGEAGPEAILPLRRGANGKLGVVAGSAGGGIHIESNVYVQADKSSSQATGSNDAVGRAYQQTVDSSIQEGIRKALRPGGIIWSAQQKR